MPVPAFRVEGLGDSTHDSVTLRFRGEVASHNGSGKPIKHPKTPDAFARLPAQNACG